MNGIACATDELKVGSNANFYFMLILFRANYSLLNLNIKKLTAFAVNIKAIRA